MRLLNGVFLALLFFLQQTIKFINSEAASIHGAIRLQSIFTSESGEWKVGGLEVVSCVKDDNAIIFSHGNLLSDSDRYTPPEISSSGWDIIKKNPLTAVDAYDFGILISEVFGDHSPGGNQTVQGANIPISMQESYRKLTNKNPKARISVSDFLDQGTRQGGFFTTPLIALTEALEHLGMKSEEEKKECLDELDRLSDDFPVDYVKMKVLPELLNCIEFSGGGPRILGIVVNISKKLSGDEFDQKITPTIVKLFGRPDRAIRVCLLDSLPVLIDKIPQKVVNDKIFPQMITGFTDAAPVVREQSIKAILTIIEKLSDKSINGELLKYLAKTSNDEQPGIRTNTTICLGRIYKNLSVRTRAKVLIAAFTRSLRDPFVHARNAALMALAVTSEVFSEEDSANKILPALCPCLIDKEIIVRAQANKTIDIYFKKLQKFAASMPDSALPPPTTDSSAVIPRMATPQSSEPATWTGWAISSFTNKISEVAGEIIASTAQSSSVVSSVPKNIYGNPESLVPSVVQPNFTLGGNTSNNSKLGKTPENSTIESLQKRVKDINENENDDDRENNEIFFDFSPTKSHAEENQNDKYEDKDDEPDFAGWLAAQAGKKFTAKPLPKGLARSISAPKVSLNSSKSNTLSTNTTTRTMTNKSASRVVVSKKIDTTPNENEDDSWGDGW